jgi:hypothetical protein
MRSTHFASGGRYPVLRSLAILYMVGAIFAAVGGIVLACWILFRLPDTMQNRVPWALVSLAFTFFMVLSMLAIAEVLKLFIDIEHNSRMVFRGEAVGVTPGGDVVDAGPNGARMGGKRWLEGEETAEGALLRGH